jgi:hypothetical protein
MFLLLLADSSDKNECHRLLVYTNWPITACGKKVVYTYNVLAFNFWLLPNTFAPITKPALTITIFLIMYCPSRVGA